MGGMGSLRSLNPLPLLRRLLGRGDDSSVDAAASPAESVASAAEETEGRSRDERAEVLQDQAGRAAAGGDDAEELRQATDRAVEERRTVEGR